MTPTEQYIEVLARLKPGELGLLRTHAGRALDESVDGFDLFAGLWWPLRQGTQRAPRREVAWLIAKLYAMCPITHSPQDYLARQLGRCTPKGEPAKQRYQKGFDRLLALPFGQIEPALRWALNWLSTNSLEVDWVKLTNDLSIWEREAKRLTWAEQFLDTNERT
ncbi:MAG: type I-E CRISPR-associated protein Cse2/CasB [Thermodesulfobacteriota bacterium]